MPLSVYHKNLLPPTGQTDGSYDTGVDGDYQAGYIGLRFIDNGDGTVSDAATRLMWVKDAQTAPGAPFDATMNWTTGLSSCESLSYAGYTDWRMPNIAEIISIVDFSASSGPRAYSPIVVAAAIYHSSTTAENSTSTTYFCDFATAWRSFGSSKATARMIIPVRGGRFNV